MQDIEAAGLFGLRDGREREEYHGRKEGTDQRTLDSMLNEQKWVREEWEAE